MPDLEPLSLRSSGQERALHPGVPPHLEAPLTEWITTYQTHEILREAALKAEVWYSPGDSDYVSSRMSAILKGIRDASDQHKAFLDVVEQILFARAHAPDDERWERRQKELQELADECAGSLDKILRLGGSKWHVAKDRLEARVDDAVRHAVVNAQKAAADTSASKHLDDAWIASYGRNPTPTRGYSEAIKAVEAAGIPVVNPKNNVATLGTMLSQMRQTTSLWRFAIPPGDIAPVITAMATLWDGQTDRHGGNKPTVPITQEAAQAAVLLAATLVHWFATGAVKRR